MFHPFQTFILGQKTIAARLASDLNIPLVFYGENEAEYGNPVANNSSALRDNKFHILEDLTGITLAGVELKDLIKNHNIKMSDLNLFLPTISKESSLNPRVQVYYLGYYLKWNPQEAYYY